MTKTMTERIELGLGIILALTLTIGAALAREPEIYVSIIVKACPLNPKSVEPGHAAASGAQGLPIGMIPRPETWGGQGQPESVRHTARTRAERHAEFKRLGCIDVPIPPEVILADMTMKMCMGKIGYLVSMQYLEANTAYKRDYPAVGEWACIPGLAPASGVAGL